MNREVTNKTIIRIRKTKREGKLELQGLVLEEGVVGELESEVLVPDGVKGLPRHLRLLRLVLRKLELQVMSGTVHKLLYFDSFYMSFIIYYLLYCLLYSLSFIVLICLYCTLFTIVYY